MLALLAGPDRLTNPIFGYLYVWIWVGLVPVSLLLGPIWSTLNPFRSLHLLLARVARVSPDRGALGRWPTRRGVWPAVVLLASFVWLELVAPDRVTIPVILMWVTVYVVVQIIGGILFGTTWYSVADPFEVYAVTMAKLSPWARDSRGVIAVRAPLANLASLLARAGIVAFVAVLLGSTAFDGFSNSSDWIRWIQQGDKPGVLLATAALAAMIAIVAVSYRFAVYWSGRLSGSPLAGEPGVFVHSLVPIALGYVVAHYLTLFVFEGQRTLLLWSDPLGLGWNVFGTAEWGVAMGFFNYTGLIAVLQAGAVVTGHVLGVVAAHDRALEVAAPTRAVSGQIPMLVVMIFYTLGGLWLLFST